MDTNPHNPGGWAISLRKFRSTWYWTCYNPQGGSFGSTHAGSKAIALSSAARAIPSGSSVVVCTENEGRPVSTVIMVTR